MIWQANDPSRSCRAALRDEVACEIRSCATELKRAGAHIDEVADGVAVCCCGALRARTIKSDDLLLLTSLALWGVGEDRAARRVLDRRSHGGPRAGEQFLSALSPAGRSPSIRAALASGLVKPSCWVTQSGEVMWTLDLMRLRAEPSDVYELTFLPGIRQLLVNLAGLWDGAGGAGLLGLRGLAGQAIRLNGGASRAARRRTGRKRTRRHRPAVEPLRRYVEDVMAGLAARRGWARTPRLVLLDL